jgi:very-short-patch-repair endonuclease
MDEPELLFTSVEAALTLLDRHRQRRRQEVPTLSIVVGAGEDPRRLARHWMHSARLVVCETSSVRLVELVSHWFDRLAAERNLVEAAAAWLGARTDSRGGELPRRLRDRTPSERELLFRRTLGASASSPAEIVCRAILEHDCERGLTVAGLREHLLAACGDDVTAMFVGLAAIFGRDGLPALFVNLPAAASLSDVEAGITSLAALTSVVPRLTALLAISPHQLEVYLTRAAESHGLALVREGLIRLDAPAEHAEFVSRPDEVAKRAPVSPPALEQAASRLEDGNDPARSRAERYLFERLQTHPETAQQFEINGVLAIGGYDRPLEVDLLARGVRVAVEIDGYFHFQDLEAYRRDRRKDILLQRAGYFVVRCLADDVMSRLEEIIDTILTAVRLRRARRLQTEEQPS